MRVNESQVLHYPMVFCPLRRLLFSGYADFFKQDGALDKIVPSNM
jgi:hypothetical protein